MSRHKQSLRMGLMVALLGLVGACGTEDIVITPNDGGTSSATAALRVVNEGNTTIYYLRLSPSSSNDWGPDQLGRNVIATGQSFTVSNVPCGQNFDLRADSSTATIATRRQVFLACGSTTTWTLFN